MGKFISAVRSLVIAAVVTIGLGGCASRSENPEHTPVSAAAASSRSTATEDQKSAVLEAVGGEYDSQELSLYLNEVAHRLTPKSESEHFTFKVIILDSQIVNSFTASDGDIRRVANPRAQRLAGALLAQWVEPKLRVVGL